MPPRKGTPNEHFRRWNSTPLGREIARIGLERAWAADRAAPKCGAIAKSTGQPCQRPALKLSGRCRFHGGATPRGDAWHRPRFEATADPAKVDRKLADLERRKKRQAARRAAMTPEERERHDAWHAAHKPGGPGARTRRRADREAAALLAGLKARGDSQKPQDGHGAEGEGRPLAAELARLEARRRAVEAALMAEIYPDDTGGPNGQEKAE